MIENPNLYKNYVAEIENNIIGFISVIFYKTAFHPGETALINELIIDKNYRNQGIGKILLLKIIEAAKDSSINEIEVSTKSDNEHAIRFYKKVGLNDESLLLGMELSK